MSVAATLPPGWSQAPVEALRMRPGLRVQQLDTASTPGFAGDRTAGEQALAARGEGALSDLQELLFANGRSGDGRSVLLVLQGMDTAGKGGIVRHVVGHMDPQGVRHRAFGAPTAQERAEHFLERVRRALPHGGEVGVFDRSHYEDVLIARAESLVPREVWEPRYDEIVAFERELVAAGTTIVKVAMFVSLHEQKKRLRARLDRPHKHWKYDPADIDKRAVWPAYAEAYQAMLDRTSTDEAPWFVIPADRKWYARLAVGELLIAALEGLRLEWPRATFDVDAEKARLEAS